jgi:hypothetical protein
LVLVVLSLSCAKPEDLAMFDEGEIMDMAPKLVHRRKFLDLRRRFKVMFIPFLRDRGGESRTLGAQYNR